jgi:hypothetical protein
MEPTLDGRQFDSEDLRRLGVGEPLELPQHEDLPIGRREPLEGLRQIEVGQGPTLFAPTSFDSQPLEVAGIPQSLGALAAHCPIDVTASAGEEPGAGGPTAPKAVCEPPGSEKSLLKSILRVLDPTGKAAAEAEEGGLVPVHELEKGLPVALGTALQEPTIYFDVSFTGHVLIPNSV